MTRSKAGNGPVPCVGLQRLARSPVTEHRCAGCRRRRVECRENGPFRFIRELGAFRSSDADALANRFGSEASNVGMVKHFHGSVGQGGDGTSRDVETELCPRDGFQVGSRGDLDSSASEQAGEFFSWLVLRNGELGR